MLRSEMILVPKRLAEAEVRQKCTAGGHGNSYQNNIN